MPHPVAEDEGRTVDAVGTGNIAIICPTSSTDALSDTLSAAGIPHGRAIDQGLDHQVTIVPVSLVKGLELDGTVVVDPDAILAEEAQGLRALYVALTRATKLLSVVHVGDLPDVMAHPVTQADRPVPERSAGVA